MVRKIAIPITILLLVGAIVYWFLFFINSTQYYTGAINYATSIFVPEPNKKGLTVNIYDSEEKQVVQSLFKYKNSHSNDLVTPIQSHGACFLIQSMDEINDRILNMENKKLVDLESKGHSIVAENTENILIADYQPQSWGLIIYNKTTDKIEKTAFQEKYLDNSGVLVQRGKYSDITNKWYIPYSDQTGTFLIIFSHDGFSKISISNKILSDIWILNASDEDITLYYSFSEAIATNNMLFSTPHLCKYRLYADNSSELLQSEVIDVNIIGKDFKVLGFYQTKQDRYLGLFTIEEGAGFRTIIFNPDFSDIKEASISTRINIEASKLSDSLIAVAGLEKALYLDEDGNIKGHNLKDR